MMPLTIITCHDVFQRVAAQRGGFLSQEYQEYSAVVLMSPKDAKALGIEEGATVKLSNRLGSIVVPARQDRGCEPGFGYMPLSLYATLLSDYQPARAKLPNLKHIEVIVEPSGEAVTPIADVWKAIIGKG